MAKRRLVERLEIDARLCKGTEGCGICLSQCREGVLGIAPNLSPRGVHLASVVEIQKCTGCELCVLFCPDLAINLVQCEVVRDG